MYVDSIISGDLSQAGSEAARAEAAGYDGGLFVETSHDPFLPIALAATQTSRMSLMTGIAVAFARNPMTVAVTASDLHRLSGGRMMLGLGSQIKPHITKRFSMPWSDPAPRMREFVQAVRAIWASWLEGVPLDFRGDYYRHTLMTPLFDQGPSELGAPPIFLAGVGPAMTAVAGEVANGFLAHGFTTPDYFRDVTMVNIERGLARAGRTRADIQISVPVMSAIGRDDTEIEVKLPELKRMLAFYGSTPAYRGVLEHHGWEDAGVELNRLSKLGEWAKMGELIDREMIDKLAIVGDEDTLVAELGRRFGGLIDRAQVTFSSIDGEAKRMERLRAVHAIAAPAAP